MTYRKVARHRRVAKRSNSPTCAPPAKHDIFRVTMFFGLLEATTTSPWGICAVIVLALLGGAARALALW